MKVKVSEASGHVLNWMVAKCEGHRDNDFAWWWDNYKPSTDWAQGGPIIEREKITVGQRFVFTKLTLPNKYCTEVGWTAQYFQAPHSAFEVHRQYGPTPLIAVMRCYVASKLGEEVDIPDELGESK